jgi:NAD(P)-dependent dehydrogenase (short-subunit alcohol dehydrogenase family)
MTILIFPNGRWRLPGATPGTYEQETPVTTEFAGTTALITGAGRGIGRAVALGVADAGASLILLARSDSQLAQTHGYLSGDDSGAIWDVSTAAPVRS